MVQIEKLRRVKYDERFVKGVVCLVKIGGGSFNLQPYQNFPIYFSLGISCAHQV